MGDIILISIGLFMIAMIIIGLKRGMLKMVFSLVSVIVVLLLVNLLTPPVKQLLKMTPVYTGVQSSIEKYIENNVETATENVTQTGVSAQKKIIDNLPLPLEVRNSLKKNNTEESYEILKVDSFAGYIAEALADMILGAITFILLFVVLTILVKILVHILDIAAKLPVIKTFNSIGGAILGFFESIIIIWILCIVVTAFSSTDWGQTICKAIADNGLLSLIYDNNMIQQFITGNFNI